MRKIAKRAYIAIFFILFQFVSLNAEDLSGLEEAYVEVKSKQLKDDFFMVKYNFEKDKVFIGLKSLYYFLEIYSLNFDLIERRMSGEINGKKMGVTFDKNESFVLDDDIYVELDTFKKKLNFSSGEWSGQDLKLTLTPNFTLPYEEREKSKVERLRLNGKQEQKSKDIIEAPKKFISPGILKFNISLDDLEKAEKNINLEYGTQFLYGDFYINQEIEPKLESQSYSLTYNNIYKENDLTFGDYYMKIPDFLRINSSVQGVSFGEENTYSRTFENVTIIKGDAQGADIVELYQNGILLDYIQPKTRSFEFEVRDRNYGGEYTLKIYYQNGQMETRKVYTVNNSKLLDKNEWSYNVQVGKGSLDNYEQKIAEVRYGLTEDISFGMGSMELQSESGKKFNILKNDLIYRVGFNYYPTLISLQSFYETKKQEESYEVRVDQRIKSYEVTFKHNKYSKYLGEDNRLQEHNSVGITKNFLNNRIALGYQEEVDIFSEEKEKGYFLSFENRSFRDWSFILDSEISRNKSKEKKIEINPGVSYSGINGITALFQADIEKNKKNTNVEYSFKVLGRRQRVKSASLEYTFGVETTYNDEDKGKMSMDFTVYFDNYLYLELPVRRDEKNKVQIGLTAEKAIDLSDLKRNVKDRQVDNSWIYGKAYIDSNNNGKYDEHEKTLSNIEVVADGQRSISNENGEYVISGVLPLNKYKVEVNRKTIDPMLIQSRSGDLVETKSSIGTRYDIPVQAVSMVTGNILAGEEISSKEMVRILSMTTVILEKNGEVYKEIDPEFDGMFFFEDVIPGNYQMKFIYLGNEFVGFSKDVLDVDVKLEKDDEGEYFEGFDVVVNKSEDKKEKLESIDNEAYDMDDILNNF